VGILVAAVLPLARVPAATAAGVGVTVDGSQQMQTMTALGVNINPNSWDNGSLKPALDMLINQAGVKSFRVAMDMIDWESTNDNSDPNTFNWNYYDLIYSGATSFDTRYAGSNFANTWNVIDYLHQKGIPDSGIELSFMGPGPSWMGGNTLNSAMEDEYVEEVLSAAYYGYSHGHTFGLFSPDNEADITANEGIAMSDTLYADAMDRLAARMNALGMSGVRLVGPESACCFDVSAMTTHPTLMAKLDHFALHDYTGSTEGAAQAVAGTGKDFWMSEYNVFDQSFPLLDQGSSGLMVWEAYDSVYNHAIVNGLGSDPGNDSYGNTALIAYDAATKTYTPRSQFYDFAQLFKFVSVGATRIGGSSGNAGVKVEAFADPVTSRLTIVGENNSSAAQTLTLSLNNLDAVPSSLQYYQTNSGSDLAQGADVTVTGGSASLTVPGSTTFTLTGIGGVADTVAPSAPADLTVTGGIGTASLSWSAATDNVAVSGYDIYRSTAAGFTPSAANKVGQTAATSFTDTGLSAGTYYFLVAARDAAGNVSAPSDEAHATVTGNTTAPTVSISSPSEGATLSGTIPVTASATNDVGIAGVQFKLDGADLGSELTSAPYSTSWDTTTTSNGSHTLAAVARNAAGTTTTSSAVTVTVSNPSNGGLLLGSNTVQGSADNNPAGEAEAFQFTATASGTADTLTFYVDSGSAATGLNVGVYSDANGQPGSLLTDGSISSPKSAAWNTVSLGSNPTLTTGSPYWIAVLGTGGQLNYRDDAPGSCSQANAAGALTALPATWSSGASWPSCNLSAYVSTAGPAHTDTTAPSIPSDVTAAAANATQVTLTWTAATDNVGVAGYHVWRGDTVIATTTSTDFTISGLSPNTADSYTVSAFDAAGNESAHSPLASVTTPADTTPPATPTGLSQADATKTSATLTWNRATDDVGVTGYHYYDANPLPLGTTTVTSVTYTGLDCAQSYLVGVDAYDAAGNTSAQATTTLTTAPCNHRPG
jgi:chitodextrinase